MMLWFLSQGSFVFGCLCQMICFTGSQVKQAKSIGCQGLTPIRLEQTASSPNAKRLIEQPEIHPELRMSEFQPSFGRQDGVGTLPRLWSPDCWAMKGDVQERLSRDGGRPSDMRRGSLNTFNLRLSQAEQYRRIWGQKCSRLATHRFPG